MKKLLAATVALSLIFACVPVFASEKTDEPIYITEKYTVKQETTLAKTDVPAIVITADSAYKQNFSFQLALTGAKFTTYESTGTLAGTNSGVSYIKIGEDKLRLTVDASKFDMTKKDLEIPLYTTLVSEGDITVTLDPKDSPLKATELTFANLSEKKYVLEIGNVKALYQLGAVGDIIIRDKSTVAVKEGSVFNLQLDNGFTFGGEGTVKGSNKFSELVKFEVNKTDASKASITVTKTTDASAGTIVLSSVSVTPSTKDSKVGPVTLSLSWPNDSTSATVANFILKVTYNTAITVDKFEGGYKPTASGSASPEKTLQIRVDGDDYGEVTVDKDGKWNYVFPYEYSNIKPGKHTFAVGYYQAELDNFFDPKEREFEIAAEKTTQSVIFTVGSKTYTVADKQGYMDAAPYIDQNGYTMLPLRAVSTALGVSTRDIKWDPATQTVSVTKDDKTIVCKIGNPELTINGKVETLETAAEIVDGSTFLPLRPMLNALGISDENIKWDKETKAVTFEI